MSVEDSPGATVLFVHESPTVERLVDRRLPEVPTRYARSVAAAGEAYDQSVAAVCLTDAVPADDASALQRVLLARDPFCQFVLVASDADDRPDHGRYDEVLERPVAADDLREALQRRLAYGAYGAALNEYYHLNAVAAAGTDAEDDEAAADGDTEGGAGERVQASLRTRRRALRDTIRGLEAALGDDHLEAAAESVRRHREMLAEDDAPGDGAGQSKYRPQSCPGCDSDWGGDGGEQGRGFERLGAGVWRCTNCGDLVRGGLRDADYVTTGR